MKDSKLENMIERIASKLAEVLGWNIIGKVDYRLWQKYGKNRTYVEAKIVCIKGKKRSERKTFGYNFGFIDNINGKHYFVPSEYCDEEDLYNDVIYKIYDYFHLMNDIKIIATDDDGNEYFVNKHERGGKLFYYPCYRPPVKGFSYQLGFSFIHEYENKEDAIACIENHIEGKRREKEHDKRFKELGRKFREAYIEATSPILDDSWKVVKIEGDEITYKRGRETMTFKISKPE